MKIEIECLPDDIPEVIQRDVSELAASARAFALREIPLSGSMKSGESGGRRDLARHRDQGPKPAADRSCRHTPSRKW